MSTIVQIQVNVDDAKALSALTNIENIGKRLSSTPIEIKINSGDGGKVARSAISLAKQKAELAKASAKQAAAEVKLQTAQEKTKQTANNLAAQQEKTAQSANRLAAKQIKAASSTSKMGTEAQKTSVLTDLLGDRLDRIVAKQAAWQLIGNGIAAVKNAFSDALSTMKDVDSELATVQKVTGMSAKKIDALGDAAYSTASKYGMSANEYLESVSTFARAGYKGAAEGLGELAIKTQLVGDTNQDIATQFLLSADAAWKYNGNVEKLSLALDKANVIDNNYATSIQKIAEGLPIVANVAAMAGMSMDETMAMLGTITATTQESGTKAATAARALILNILGDTTTEISDGVTATEESVQSLSGILQKYAPDVVAAAKATGELINPMEAIEALSKAAKDGLISEADLMTMVSALGGKLRTNQLLALLENFDMYKSMMEDMSTAAGSADDELGVMLDTWAAKTNILKNTWTEFVSHIADTEAIKAGLDLVIGLVEVLDSGFGKFAVTVAGTTVAVALLSKGIVALETGITALALSQGPLAAGVTTTAAAFKVLTGAMLANPLFWVAGGAALIYGIVKGVDALTTTYDEQGAVVQQLESEYEAAYGQGSRLDELKSKTEALTEAERREKEILQERADVANLNLQQAKDAEYDLWRQGWTNASTTGKYDEFGNYLGEEYTTKATQWLNGFRGAIAGVRAEYEEGKMLDSEYAQRLSEISSGYDDLVEQIEHYQEEGREIPSSLQEILDLYNSLNHQIAEITQTTGDAEGATENTASSLKEAADAADAAAQAVERYNNALSGLSDREEAANDIQSKFNKALKDFQDGKLGSIELGKFLDTYIPDDVKRELEYNIEDMMEWVLNGNVGRILNSDNMFGEFYDVIKENVDSGALDGIVTMDDQGVIRTITSYKELAEALQITEAQAEAFGHGLSNYMDGVFYTGEEAQQIVGDVGKVLSTSFSDGTASLSDFTQALSEITGANTSTELSGVFAGLMRAGALDWKTMLGAGSMEDAMQIINSYLHSIDEGVDQLSENPADVKINFDADEAVAGLEGIEAKKAQVEGPAEVQATVTGAEDAEQKLNNVQNAKSGAQGTASVAVTADGASTAAGEIGDVSNAASNLPARKNVTINAGGNALGVIDSIKSSMASVRNKTVTITVVEKHVNGKGSTTGGFGPADSGSDGDYHLAQGAEDFVGGKAIVNDGAPVNGSSAELIMDKQGAYIANDGKMTAVELEPGAKVFTAKETQEIFKEAKKSFISTFAGGTGLVRPGGNSSVNGGVYSGSYGGGTGAGGSTASDSDDALKKEIDEKLDNLDKQIKLAQNRNDKAKEQALQQEAAKLIREYVQKYLDKGYSNTSNEVLDLLNKGYGYSDDLMNELVDALESLTNATDEANKLAEKEQALEKARQELENTKKQRTVRIYNAATQQWEWVAKADDILKAQEKLAEAEKDYNDAKLEQELDAIRNGNIGDIGDLTMSPALRELISKASEEEQRRITDILHAISGGATGTVDATGESIFRSTDSHDVYYQFGDLKLSEAEAKNMTVKELADQLRTLSLT